MHVHMHHGADKVFQAETPHASADMNVTPLIDVLLVLLVIFMATLPLTQKGLDINLPLEVSKNTQQTEVLNQIVIDLSADHRLTVNKTEVQIADLENKLRDIFETRKEKTIFIIGDPNVKYGEVTKIIDAAVGAGVTKVGIVTMGMREEAARGGQ